MILWKTALIICKTGDCLSFFNYTNENYLFVTDLPYIFNSNLLTIILTTMSSPRKKLNNRVPEELQSFVVMYLGGRFMNVGHLRHNVHECVDSWNKLKDNRKKLISLRRYYYISSDTPSLCQTIINSLSYSNNKVSTNIYILLNVKCCVNFSTVKSVRRIRTH